MASRSTRRVALGSKLQRRSRRNLRPGPAETCFDERGHEVTVTDMLGQPGPRVFVTWDEWQLAAQCRMGMISKDGALRRGRPLNHTEMLRATAHEMPRKNDSGWMSV